MSFCTNSKHTWPSFRAAPRILQSAFASRSAFASVMTCITLTLLFANAVASHGLACSYMQWSFPRDLLDKTRTSYAVTCTHRACWRLSVSRTWLEVASYRVPDCPRHEACAKSRETQHAPKRAGRNPTLTLSFGRWRSGLCIAALANGCISFCKRFC